MKQIKRVINSMESWVSLTLMMQKRFERKDAKPLVIIIRPLDKSHEQLGYLHGVCLPILTEVLHDAGEIKNKSESEAKYYLKVLIGFGSWISFRSSIIFDPRSFESATTEDLSRAIDEAIKQCELRGAYVPQPTTNKDKE
jgi:hypothetical protein